MSWALPTCSGRDFAFKSRCLEYLPCSAGIEEAISEPTTKSGHADKVTAVRRPAPMIATLASASFLADKKGARVRLPLVCYGA